MYTTSDTQSAGVLCLARSLDQGMHDYCKRDNREFSFDEIVRTMLTFIIQVVSIWELYRSRKLRLEIKSEWGNIRPVDKHVNSSNSDKNKYYLYPKNEVKVTVKAASVWSL